MGLFESIILTGLLIALILFIVIAIIMSYKIGKAGYWTKKQKKDFFDKLVNAVVLSEMKACGSNTTKYLHCVVDDAEDRFDYDNANALPIMTFMDPKNKCAKKCILPDLPDGTVGNWSDQQKQMFFDKLMTVLLTSDMGKGLIQFCGDNADNYIRCRVDHASQKFSYEVANALDIKQMLQETVAACTSLCTGRL